MYYQKIVSGKWEIEFHNSWSGAESVYVNGQLVSKKSSFWGTSHYFQMEEAGQPVKFILVTKVGANMQVMIDLFRDGVLLKENLCIPYGSMPRKPHLEFKKSGLAYLNDFDLELALADLQEAASISPEDPELYFYMACAYSVMEEAWEGFQCLKEAVSRGLKAKDFILTHDMLAYLRMHPAFEAFKASGFTEIKKAYLKESGAIVPAEY